MTVITIKKEDFKNINEDIDIHIFKNEIQSNVILDPQKMVDLPKENGWKVSGFQKLNSSLF